MSKAKLDNLLVEWLGPSWRTRLSGWLTVTVSLALLFSSELGITDAVAFKITNALAAITGFGLAKARDNRVSSEEVRTCGQKKHHQEPTS